MKFTKEEIRKSMQLYVVTDRSWLKEGQTLAEVCDDVLANGGTFLQIREKELPEEAFTEEALKLKAVCAKYHVPYVVNDSVEICMAIDADGVHCGQEDIMGRDLRSILGPDKILGISAHSVEEAQAAEAAGADYIGVGAVFETGTKKNVVALSVEKLKEISSSVSIPVVGIGGITAKNILEMKGSCVDGVAVVSAIFAQEDPGQAAAEMLALSGQMIAHE